MNLYKIGVKGGLGKKVSKIDFANDGVYLIDDIKTIYLWFGKDIPENRKQLSEKKATELNNKRENPATIQLINQGKEFGAFLAIRDLLHQGLTKDAERRSELELQYEDAMELMELVELGFEADLEAEITISAHDISKEEKSYKELCKELAEIQLAIMKANKKPTQAEIKKKAKEIFDSSSTYEELCWLIAELRNLQEKQTFKK